MFARFSRAAALCCALACLSLMLLPALALADTAVVSTPPNTTVNLEPLWTQLIVPIVTTVLGTIITALIAWVAAFISKRTGLEIDAKNREALHSAAMTGINLAIAKLGTKVSSVSIDTKSVLVTDAIKWVEASVPGAIAHFGISASALNDLVASKLTAVLGTEAVADKPAAPLSAAAALPKPA